MSAAGAALRTRAISSVRLKGGLQLLKFVVAEVGEVGAFVVTVGLLDDG